MISDDNLPWWYLPVKTHGDSRAHLIIREPQVRVAMSGTQRIGWEIREADVTMGQFRGQWPWLQAMN